MMISSIIARVRNEVTVSAGRTRIAWNFLSTLPSDKVSTAKPSEHSMSQANGVASPRLTGDSISPHVKKAEYAVRGDIVVRAGEIGKELKAGKKFPFSDLVMCNIGNPQALGQKPVTFYRQVLAICDYPQVGIRHKVLGNACAVTVIHWWQITEFNACKQVSVLAPSHMQLLDTPESQKLFPPDVLKRAKEYLDATGTGGTGAYTHSQGVELCREHVAKVRGSFLMRTCLQHIDGTCCLCKLKVSHAVCTLLLCFWLTVAYVAAQLAASVVYSKYCIQRQHRRALVPSTWYSAAVCSSHAQAA